MSKYFKTVALETVTGKNNSNEMGATGNNSSRLITLQERKKQIEETLAKRNQELRELCLQEAEITGITPPEMPLEIGETPPTMRRLVGTTFQLPENLVQNFNNKDEIIQSLELQIQLHANLAEAALGLANEQNMSKTIKRQHRHEYQKHKNHCLALQEKLALLKEKQSMEQPKQKKKPRAVDIVKQSPTDSHSSVSNNNNNDPLFNADVRHSMRYIKTSKANNTQTMEYPRYSQSLRRHPGDHPYPNQQRYDDIFSGIYGLNLNGYNKYLERQENFNNVSPSYGMNMYQYNSGHSQLQQTSSYYVPQYNSQHSPQLSHQGKSGTQQNHIHMQNLYYSQRSPQHHSPQLSTPPKYFDYPHLYNYGNVSPQKTHSYNNTLQNHMDYKQNYQNDSFLMNPHQIQPHQQYEHTNVITSGLGGCWKKNERGELVWSANDMTWQRDKRFGSLDRRKNKRIVKVPTNIDNKSVSSGGISSPQEPVLNNVPINTARVVTRRSADRQLVRTQSLGSVGAQTLDSVYPSDDNSSCGSDNRNRSNSQTLQKSKRKEWVETALDSPVEVTRNQLTSNFKPLPIPPSALAPEEKYFVNNTPPLVNPIPSPVSSPVISKPPLEIPAESNPSPKLPDANKEFFSSPINNQNFTIVQAGQCKPYHEETKPFEMSDFYKYSTKFKKSLKQENATPNSELGNVRSYENVSEQNSNNSYSSKRFYDHSPTSVKSFDNSRGVNANIDANHFQTDVNRWYEGHQLNNSSNRPEGCITDTLV